MGNPRVKMCTHPIVTKCLLQGSDMVFDLEALPPNYI